jgi:hypothetical protein
MKIDPNGAQTFRSVVAPAARQGRKIPGETPALRRLIFHVRLEEAKSPEKISPGLQSEKYLV